MNGKVKFFNRGRSFGFIIGEDDKEYFVHISSIAGEPKILFEDDEVEFDTEKTEKGLAAINVKKIRE